MKFISLVFLLTILSLSTYAQTTNDCQTAGNDSQIAVCLIEKYESEFKSASRRDGFRRSERGANYSQKCTYMMQEKLPGIAFCASVDYSADQNEVCIYKNVKPGSLRAYKSALKKSLGEKSEVLEGFRIIVKEAKLGCLQ